MKVRIVPKKREANMELPSLEVIKKRAIFNTAQNADEMTSEYEEVINGAQTAEQCRGKIESNHSLLNLGCYLPHKDESSLFSIAAFEEYEYDESSAKIILRNGTLLNDFKLILFHLFDAFEVYFDNIKERDFGVMNGLIIVSTPDSTVQEVCPGTSCSSCPLSIPRSSNKLEYGRAHVVDVKEYYLKRKFGLKFNPNDYQCEYETSPGASIDDFTSYSMHSYAVKPEDKDDLLPQFVKPDGEEDIFLE